MKKFNHYEVFSITLNVVYIVTQLSLFTFTILTCIENI